MTDEVHREEAEIVRRCQDGDLEAFESIYRRHGRSLFSLAYRMVGNLTDAEDLLQEIFLLAFDKLPTYQGRSSLRTWLHRLAVNRCLDYLRSRAARNRSLTESFDDRGHASSPSAGPGAPEERLDLERAIRQLPRSYRAAFLLYDVEGFGHREVAEILGVAEGTSKSLVHKARLKIREQIGASAPGEKR